MNIFKAVKRDRKREKRRNGPREDGRSVFEIERIQRDRSAEIKKQRQQKQKFLEGEFDGEPE